MNPRDNNFASPCSIYPNNREFDIFSNRSRNPISKNGNFNEDLKFRVFSPLNNKENTIDFIQKY